MHRNYKLTALHCTTEHFGAAVSTMEIGNQWVKGLIRFVQTEPDKLVIDGTIDGLSPGRHALCVHEYGDVSEGCTRSVSNQNLPFSFRLSCIY